MFDKAVSFSPSIVFLLFIEASPESWTTFCILSLSKHAMFTFFK